MVVQGHAFLHTLHEVLSSLQDIVSRTPPCLTEHAGRPILDIDAVLDHEGLPPATQKRMNTETQKDSYRYMSKKCSCAVDQLCRPWPPAWVSFGSCARRWEGMMLAVVSQRFRFRC